MRVFHWDSDAIDMIIGQDLIGQPAGFGAENEAVVFHEFPLGVSALALCREVNESGSWQSGIKCGEVNVPAKCDVLPIVEARTSQRAIVHSETGNTNNMKFGFGRGAESGNVARVWRDLGLKECDVKHIPT